MVEVTPRSFFRQQDSWEVLRIVWSNKSEMVLPLTAHTDYPLLLFARPNFIASYSVWHIMCSSWLLGH